MSTESIFTTVKITDPKKAEEFINALDEMFNSKENEKKEKENSLITDKEKLEEIRGILLEGDK